ncbi:MAG: hypothetical protein M5U28_30565 [Sandaracinaceae bacterium]|nr:hypothetical protein [Sandaracinaceae bacterium]
MRRALALALALTACESGPVIVAEEGGVVESPDGVLRLVLPPGALPRDTVVTIRVLTEDEWPVNAPSRFTRIGEVYAIEPGGLELLEDAYAVVFPPDPSILDGEAGALIASAYQWSPRTELVAPAPATRTWRLADGRIAVVGTLYELGTTWVGDKVTGAERALTTLHASIAGAAGEHAAGEEWRADALALTAGATHVLFEREVTASVISTDADAALVPSGVEGASVVRWDATLDPALGLHAFEVFGVEGARTEARITAGTRQPVTLEPDVPLAPAVDPLPGWRCDAASGEDQRLFLGVDVVTGASSGVVTVGVAQELGAARCR